jgi:hypothetical protein
MRTLVFLLLTGILAAGEAAPQTTAPSTVNDAMTMVGKLPDPLVTQHLNDFFATATPEVAGQVLMHIAISAARPARPVVLPMLAHRSPLVVERALRALTSIGLSGDDQRLTVERLLSHDNPQIAIQAATCLGSGDDLRAVPALIAGLKSPPEVAGAALSALQRLSAVDFKNDATAWEAWYRSNRLQASERLGEQSERLASADPKEQVKAIQALAGMRNDRAEAVTLIEPFRKSADATVAIAARQALATLAPGEFAMPSAGEVMGAVKPPKPSAPAAPTGVVAYLSSQGLFDTWLGLLITAFTGICLLSLALFLLRSAPVQNATRRFGRVIIAGTVRFVKPVGMRLQEGTKRIVRTFSKAPAKPDANSKPEL